MRTILRTLALVAPLSTLAPVALSACSGADGAGVPDDPGTSGASSATTTACKKKVHLHIADFQYTERFDEASNAGVKPNGCWDFDKLRGPDESWGICWGASNQDPKDGWVSEWGGTNNWSSGNPRMWVYNETAYSHDGTHIPSDDTRAADCWSRFANHWTAELQYATSPAKGYAYMTYQGSNAHWKTGPSSYIAHNFAELYGKGNWWPFWNRWKGAPVGRPMAQIPNVNRRINAYSVTKGLCDKVASGEYIGLYIPSALHPRTGTSNGDPTWSQLTWETPSFKGIVSAMNACTASTPAVMDLACDMDMPAGTVLEQGDSWLSCNGTYELDMQDDGNLVIYQNGVATWSSGTQGTDSTYAIMQSDGNFVVYGASGAHWATGTQGHAGASIIMQDDGNLVVYGAANHKSPLWGSKSSAPPPPPSCSPDKAAGWSLGRGQDWITCDGRFRLSMQTDGNLVVYEGATALWGSGTQGSDAQYVTMQSDGNLVVYGTSGAHWASNTGGHGGAYVAFQNDGNLVVYGGANHTSPLWATSTGGH